VISVAISRSAPKMRAAVRGRMVRAATTDASVIGGVLAAIVEVIEVIEAAIGVVVRGMIRAATNGLAVRVLRETAHPAVQAGQVAHPPARRHHLRRQAQQLPRHPRPARHRA
jgi:hypothetical protein